MSNRRALRVILLIGLLLSVACASAARGDEREPVKDAGPDWFRELDDAAARGAIDPVLAKRLDGGEPVTAFAVLDPTDVLAAYGDGSRRGIATAEAVLAKMREAIQSDVHVEVVHAFDVAPLLVVRLETADQAVALLNSRFVRSITADEENQPWLTQSLPLIRQPQVNAGHLRGDGVAVAVLDSGLDYTRFAFGPCSAPGTPSTAGGTCRVAKALDVAPDDGMRDDNAVGLHGTNVAGIVAGVAPGAKLISIDVLDGPTAWDHDVIAGLDWVLTHHLSDHIRAVNLSLGHVKDWNTSSCNGGFFDRNPFVYSFTLARAAGIVPVVAAGNDAVYNGAFQDGLPSPACAGGFSVGAVYDAGPTTKSWGDPNDSSLDCTDTNAPVDSVTCFSQDGPQLDLLAPGASITAAGITMGGTSQAAPHVAGAAAILAAARPYSTEQELEGYLKTSATQITDPRTGRIHPRLDLVSAVRAAFPVPNDNRAAATPLTAWGGHYEQTTWTATKEPGEPSHAGNAGGASVWFRWTAARSGSASISTQGSDYDTLLAVYRLDANGALVPVAASDDVAGATTSAVQFTVTAGDVLLIAVDGRALTPTVAASGDLKLTTNLPNDDIAGALPIGPGWVQNGANVGATHEAGEPMHCDDTFASRSVWYRWTPSTTTSATVHASGTSMLCVAVYEASSSATGFGLLSPVAYASDDQGHPAEVAFTGTPGHSYWIAVDGVSYETNCNQVTGQCWYGTTAGPFTLSMSVP